MGRTGLDRKSVIAAAAGLANNIGIENLSLKILAEELGIKSPSLYNHVESLEDLKHQLMLYGWKGMEQQMLQAAAGVSGYDAIRAICHTFYQYATQNPGLFNAMLWYNKFRNPESMDATSELFPIMFRISSSLNISEEHCNHLIRTIRAFLEGFALLVNNESFGNPVSIEESFELSLDVLIAGIKTLENEPFTRKQAQEE